MSPDRMRRQRPVRGKSLIARPPSRRPARVVYVVAEGGVTEPDYCTALNNHFSDRHGFWIETEYVRKKGLKPTEVAERAVAAASDVKERRGRAADASPYPLREVWALFDRDEHEGVRSAFAHLRRQNCEAAAHGSARRVEIAFSSPSFDLWLLLHFQSLTTPQQGSSEVVHEKLRAYPSFETFAKDTAGTKRITEHRAVQLMRADRLETAAKNSRALVRQCRTEGCSPTEGHTEDCDPLSRDPSTDVWRLIESLGIVLRQRWRIPSWPS